MSQEKSKTMPMQFFFLWGGGGGKEVYYGIVQVENDIKILSSLKAELLLQ